MARSRTVALVIAALALLALAFLTLRPKQPSYGGKTIEQWLNTTEPIPPEAVRAMGTNCIPLLLKTIKAKPSAVSDWLDWGLRKLGWRNTSAVKLSQMKGRASEAFVVLGTNAVSAIGELVKLLEGSHDSDSRIAAFCLAGLGEIGIAELVKALQHKNAVVRADAAAGCYYASLRPEMNKPPGMLAKLATPHLLHCTTNDSFPAAVLSLRALAEFNRESPWIVPTLMGMLQDPNVLSNTVVLTYALQTIGYFGKRAAQSSNAVAQFLSHPNRRIAREASNTLWSLNERP